MLWQVEVLLGIQDPLLEEVLADLLAILLRDDHFVEIPLRERERSKRRRDAAAEIRGEEQKP